MGTGNQANLVRATKTAGFFPVGPPNVEPSWVPVPVPNDDSRRGLAVPAFFHTFLYPTPPLPMAYLDQKPGLPRQQLPQILARAASYLTRTKPLNPQTGEWQCGP